MEWIKCSDRMPEGAGEDDFVHIAVRFDFDDGDEPFTEVKQGVYVDGCWWQDIDFEGDSTLAMIGGIHCTVTHWMPLMAPPKE